ncbi:MAG: thioredoxin family protein [Pirellulales bacterium]|nr:thioredoxin family protein [Pirellulales bacterium]
MLDYAAIFPQGLDYRTFLERHGSVEHRRRWEQAYQALTLPADAQRLLAGFKRQMNVLCLAGAWCGDCIYQCPIFARIAEACPRIDLRFFDRDAHPHLASELKICGGNRVPVVVMLSEDQQEVARCGDRTLSRYRQLAAQLEGAACPTGLALPDAAQQQQIVADWLAEFERAQLILRTSPRLRERHGD